MITITINDKVYNDIPSSYEEMSLGKYQKLLMDVFIKQKENKYPEEYGAFIIIAELIGCSLNDVMNMMPTDVELLLDTFSYILSTDNLPKNENDFIEINKTKYAIRKDFNGMNTGEMIMCENILKGKEINYDKLHILLSIILRPAVTIKDEFGEEIVKIKDITNIDDIMKRADMFSKELKVNDIWHILESFLNGEQIYQKGSATSLSRLTITKQ